MTSWSVVKIVILVLAITGIGGYAVYKYRIRVLLFDCLFYVHIFLFRIEVYEHRIFLQPTVTRKS